MIHRFRLAISADEYLRWYRGEARRVRVRTQDGLVIEFPAVHLRPFVRHDGIHGEFELETTEDHRFIALRRLAD